MLRKVLFAACIIFLLVNSVASAQEVNWISFDQLNEKMRAEPRPIMVFIHTNWCKFCAMQDNNTFKDQTVVQKLNEEYYCLRLNAEDKKEITFLNRKYGFNSSGANTGNHELAKFLGTNKGTLTFPTTVILSNYFQPIYRTAGFINKEVMLTMISKAE